MPACLEGLEQTTRLELAVWETRARARRRSSLQSARPASSRRSRPRGPLAPPHILVRWAVLARRRRWARDHCAAGLMLHQALGWRNSWVCWLAWRLAALRPAGPGGALLHRAAASLELFDRLTHNSRLGRPGAPAERSLEAERLSAPSGRPAGPRGYAALLLRACVRSWAAGSGCCGRPPACRGGRLALQNAGLGLAMAWLLWTSLAAAAAAAAREAVARAALRRLRGAPRREALQDCLRAWRALLPA